MFNNKVKLKSLRDIDILYMKCYVQFSIKIIILYPNPGFQDFFCFFIFRNISPLILDPNYISLKNQVIKAERRILKELGFCVHVKHPHKVNIQFYVLAFVLCLSYQSLLEKTTILIYCFNIYMTYD